MTERSIRFNAHNVRATLAGTMTQIRCVVKSPNVGFIGGAGQQADPACWGFADIDGCWHVLDQSAKPWHGQGICGESYAITCPYGAPGDTLWVRETWQAWSRTRLGYGEWKWDIRKGDLPFEIGPIDVMYAADGDGVGPWRPSIHMPQWASRITLRVTSVRVERLQDISEEDAQAEGCKSEAWDECCGYPVRPSGECCGSPIQVSDYRGAFKTLWESNHGAESWIANPWVWVIGFARVKP